MNVKVTKDNYTLLWLKLLIDIKLQIPLTKREYDLLVEMARYSKVSLEERKEISGRLNCSEQVISNNLKLLKDKGLVDFIKQDKSYSYTLNIPVPKSIDDLLSRTETIQFTKLCQ
jgi:predicted transcriptional regulator